MVAIVAYIATVVERKEKLDADGAVVVAQAMTAAKDVATRLFWGYCHHSLAVVTALCRIKFNGTCPSILSITFYTKLRLR